MLVLVAPDHRTVRIEVGYGLEPILPDGLAGEIIRTEMIPEFRNDNYPRGIGRGLNRISQIVRRDPAAVASRAPGGATGNDPPPAIVIVPFFGIFIALGAFAAGLGIRTKTYGPLLGGSLCAGIPLLMTVAFSSVFSLFILAPLGLAVLAAGYSKGSSAYWTGILRKGIPDNSVRDDEPSEWVMGGAPRSSAGESPDSGGSSSGADFGGGSSGGGGATGRW